MTPERLREIERLFHEARERPPAERDAWLARACADDPTLRREVESLLAQPPAGLIDAPVGALVAGLVAPASVLLSRTAPRRLRGAGTAGRRAGWARSTARATRGWAARSAIKILPRAFKDDPDRLARFEREARVLASLNHPHIGAIYGLEEADGVTRLVMELVEGEDAGGAHRTRSDPDRRRAADRATDRRGARSGARAGHHPSRSEARQHQGARRRHGQGARLRAGQSARPAGGDGQLADPHRGAHAGRDHPRHRGLHEPGAGARPGGRQARRHLGVRLRARYEMLTGPAAFRGETISRHDCGDPRARAGLGGASGDNAASHRAPSPAWPGERPGGVCGISPMHARTSTRRWRAGGRGGGMPAPCARAFGCGVGGPQSFWWRLRRLWWDGV